MRFYDLPEDHWAYSYVSYLFCNGVISGYADGTFRPGASTTRGQLTKLLALGFGWTLYNPVFPDFTDVPFGSTFYQYIETAYIRGIISGYADGTFRPGNEVSRAQVAKMLVLAKGWEVTYPVTPDFTDVPSDNWAYGYVETAFYKGVVSGYADGTYRPGNPVNRAQVSKMLTLTLQQPLTPKTGTKPAPPPRK
jgi:nitrogen fixation protein